MEEAGKIDHAGRRKRESNGAEINGDA